MYVGAARSNLTSALHEHAAVLDSVVLTVGLCL